MIETIVDLVPVYGLALVFASVVLGCAGVPAPATVSLVVGGAFVASGDMALGPLLAVGLVGAFIGDQTGYWAGVRGSAWATRFGTEHGASDSIARARRFIDRWGGLAVFFSRWLVSPLGPPVNVASGMLAMPWSRFTLYGLAGKLIWVGLFVGLGYAFSQSLATVVEVTGSIGLGAAAAVALAVGAYTLLRFARARARLRSSG